MDEFKRFFLRGLAAVLPTLLTIALFLWAYRLVDTYIGRYITLGMLEMVSLTGPPELVDPDVDALKYGEPIDEWRAEDGERLTVEYKVITHNALRSRDPDVRRRAERAAAGALWQIAFKKYHLHLVGFLMAIIVVYFVGMFLASFFGRATWRLAEKTLSRMPLVRAIYPNIKQVTDFLFGENKLEFSGVVAVPYPRKGIWSLGFLTGSPMAVLSEVAQKELVTVFIPSSPTPMTGYTITVPREDIIELAVTVDEALRFTISAGVIKPHTRLAGTREGESKAAGAQLAKEVARVQISVVGRHFEVPDDIRGYIEEKAARLPRYYDRVQMIEVVMERESDLASVEMIVSAAGVQPFVAKEIGVDIRACVDLLVDKLERQLTKHKEKQRNRKHIAKKPATLEGETEA